MYLIVRSVFNVRKSVDAKTASACWLTLMQGSHEWDKTTLPETIDNLCALSALTLLSRGWMKSAAIFTVSIKRIVLKQDPLVLLTSDDCTVLLLLRFQQFCYFI